MPVYVADTHALIWHLTNDAKLGVNAKQILDDTDNGLHAVWIPAIALVETVYISEKHGVLPRGGARLLSSLATAVNYRVAPLDLLTVMAMQTIPRGTIKDMADRIITATALRLGVPLITKDPVIKVSGFVSVVW